MTLARWASLAIALVGVLVLSIRAPESATREGLAIDWRNLGLVNKDFVVGNLLVLLGCTGSCLFNVCSKSLLCRFSLAEILTYSYLLALAADAAMLVAFEPSSLNVLFVHSTRTWIGLFLVGGIANGLAMALWLFLLTRMDVSQASVSVYLLPFFGVLQAAVFLHEQITLRHDPWRRDHLDGHHPHHSRGQHKPETGKAASLTMRPMHLIRFSKRGKS